MKRRRPGGLLLASLALLAVAVAAGTFLWSLRAGPSPADQARGGSLLGPATAPIDALLLNVRGRSYRFDRQPGGAWTLGGALADDLDPGAMSGLIDALEAAVTGPLLPGTEPGDRRYEFNGPEGVQLTVHRADGRQLDLALGLFNPLTGARYASGAGRRFCFTVPVALRDRLAGLPDAVRARTLVPGLNGAGIDRITLEREGQVRALVRRDGRWWLRAPDGAGAYGPLAASYQAQYDDRRRSDAEGLWVQASTRAVERLVYEVGDAAVRELTPPERAAELAATWGLAPPWRRVTLAGPDVRPTLRGAPGDDGAAPTLAFGPPLDERFAPALRRGQVLVVDREAVYTLSLPLADLVDLGALPVPALAADSLAITFEGRPLLRGSRRGDPGAGDGRAAWLTDEPPAEGWTRGEAARHGLVRDLIVNLNRQPIVQVLPPRTAPDPLRPDGRLTVRLTYGLGAGARALRWDVGWLREPAGEATAGLWTPDSGRLVAIPGELLVSVRNAAAQVAPRR